MSESCEGDVRRVQAFAWALFCMSLRASDTVRDVYVSEADAYNEREVERIVYVARAWSVEDVPVTVRIDVARAETLVEEAGDDPPAGQWYLPRARLRVLRHVIKSSGRLDVHLDVEPIVPGDLHASCVVSLRDYYYGFSAEADLAGTVLHLEYEPRQAACTYPGRGLLLQKDCSDRGDLVVSFEVKLPDLAPDVLQRTFVAMFLDFLSRQGHR
jgi:hypothetical protein